MYEVLNNEGEIIQIDKAAFDQLINIYVTEHDVYSTLVQDVNGKMHVVMLDENRNILQAK